MYCKVYKNELSWDERAFPPRNEVEFWEDLRRIRSTEAIFTRILEYDYGHGGAAIDLERMRLCK